jgi:RNA polymerase sigma-70 factor (ECF subfamily)
MTSTPPDYRQVVEKYENLIYGLALSRLGSKFDADDVFQEVFLIYFKKNKTFNDEEHRKAWLIKTTLNCCKRTLYSTWRKKTAPLEEAYLNNMTYQFVSHEENAVFTALRELPEKYRTVLHLFYFEDFSTEKIANILGINGGAVRMRLKRGRDLMHEKLKGEFSFG